MLQINTDSFFQNYSLFDGDKIIVDIIIYDKKEGIIVNTGIGWFEEGQNMIYKSPDISLQMWVAKNKERYVKDFSLPVETVRRAIKANFEKNDVFFIKNYCYDNDRNYVNLYIPSTMISVEDMGENKEAQSHCYKFTLLDENCKFTLEREYNNKLQSIIFFRFLPQDNE